MSIANFIPQLWSARLLNHLDKALVLAKLCNRDYEGEIKKFGDTVKIQRPGNIPTLPNTRGGTVTYNYPTSSTRSLVMNQRTAAAFKVDDVDQIQANVGLVDTYTERVGYSMADDVDRFIASLFVNAGAGDVAISDISGTIASGTIFNAFANASLSLDALNVPAQGRWAAISPALHNAMLRDARIVQATITGDQIINQGVGSVGTLAGFNLYKTVNLSGTGVTVTLTATSLGNTTTLTVTALSAAIPVGTILIFGPGRFAKVTVAAIATATSITVAPLSSDILSGSVATYVKTRKCLFGSNAAITFGQQEIPNVEAMRAENSFDDLLRALQVYGATVVEPDALGTFTVVEAP